MREKGLSRLVFVGASLTGRMATMLGLSEQVVYLMGSDKMGMPVPSFQSEQGRYHISGCQFSPGHRLEQSATPAPLLEKDPLPTFVLVGEGRAKPGILVIECANV